MRYQNPITLPEPKAGDLRVWWIPQVPMAPIYFYVPTVHEGVRLLDALARYDLFQHAHRIKPDYSNAGDLEMYDLHGDEGERPGWTAWEWEGHFDGNGDKLYFDNARDYVAQVPE